MKNMIQVLNKDGYFFRRIVKILGCHHSTIARDLKRWDTEYKAHATEIDKKSQLPLIDKKPKQPM